MQHTLTAQDPASSSLDRWGNFHLATVMFRRALQLRSGANPRVDGTGHKSARVAYLEVMAGTVSWEVLAELAPAAAA